VRLDAAFAARLNGAGPVGVAVSGGGDSLALLHLLAAWGRRPLHVFCVDHGIHPDSAMWTRRVGAAAARLGADFTALRWTGAKPATGLAAAARLARHRLLAVAARTAGCRVVCLGHTADDVLEARVMRAAGSNVGAPRVWAPSPVWPEGRGLFLFRPLLDVRRAALRDWLTARGVDWIDDPANASAASLRARARRDLAGGGEAAPPEAAPGLPDGLLVEDDLDAFGVLRFDAARLAERAPDDAARLLAAAAVCAGGGDRLPRRAQAGQALAGLATGARILCGARLWRRDGLIWIAREAGDLRRHPPRIHAEAGMQVWDGRFELAAGLRVSASAEARAALSEAERRRLLRLPAPVRGALPVADSALAPSACWVTPRFKAAAGAFATERDLAAVPKRTGA